MTSEEFQRMQGRVKEFLALTTLAEQRAGQVVDIAAAIPTRRTISEKKAAKPQVEAVAKLQIHFTVNGQAAASVEIMTGNTLVFDAILNATKGVLAEEEKDLRRRAAEL